MSSCVVQLVLLEKLKLLCQKIENALDIDFLAWKVLFRNESSRPVSFFFTTTLFSPWKIF